MKINPLVSIAMTTYNGAQFLEDQINSILQQTYSNIELIVVDDCSTDNTYELLESFLSKDKRIHIFKNKNNIGFVKNFCKAISLCSGDFIALSDQDDIWEDWKIEKQINSIKDFDLLCTNSLLIDEYNNSLGLTMKETLCFTEIPSNQDYLFKYLCHKNFVQGSTILATSAFLKEQIKEVNQFSDFLFHDHLFALKASINNGIIYLPDCTIRYRQHGEQVTKNLNTVNKNKEDKNYKKIIDILLFVKSFNLSMNQIIYVNDTIKYYKELHKKTVYTIVYFYKYFYFLYFSNNKIKKIFLVLKKIIGYIINKLI